MALQQPPQASSVSNATFDDEQGSELQEKPYIATEATTPAFPVVSQERLSIPFALRLPTTVAGGFFIGAGLGTVHGTTMAGLRFRAEHAHKLPKNEVGWYLYHKSKNYNAILGGIKEGARMGLKAGFWIGTFCWSEEAVDRARSQFSGGTGRDFLSTMIAGLSTAGGFSLWNRFDLPTTARTAKFGLKFGLAFGLLQDLLSVAKGNRPHYVDVMLPSRWKSKADAGGVPD